MAKLSLSYQHQPVSLDSLDGLGIYQQDRRRPRSDRFGNSSSSPSPTVAFIQSTNRKNHNKIYASPTTKVRNLEADESFVLAEYNAHARKCRRCGDALDAFREGRSLCARGLAHARDVANYVFVKSGNAYSAVDHEHGKMVLIRIPREYQACRRLLRATEEGLRLYHEPPMASDDATDWVGASQPTAARVAAVSRDNDREPTTETVERVSRPRGRAVIYHRTAPGQASPHRGSLYEADRIERQQRRQDAHSLRQTMYRDEKDMWKEKGLYK